MHASATYAKDLAINTLEHLRMHLKETAECAKHPADIMIGLVQKILM
jgi:hypothetical protein